MKDIDFAPTQQFTRNGRTVRWTQYAKCFACGEHFTGKGRTEVGALADTKHWAELHQANCSGEGGED